jgi:CheY-like chemotaxis protein
MVISDLHMQTEDAGLDVIRRARGQAYDPATALLTAYAPPGERRGEHSAGELDRKVGRVENPDSVLIKPLGTGDLLRQVEALLVSHADRQLRQRNSASKAEENQHRAG